MKILITGTTGESLPPPYAGIPKLSLLVAGIWNKQGHKIGLTFTYHHDKEDDLEAGAEYFFEYNSKPDKLKKIFFLMRWFFANPFLYKKLLRNYLKADPHIFSEAILYPAYGVFMDRIFSIFKPDIVLSEAALIKTFMVAQIARRRKVPVVFDTYAEIHDLSMGANKRLSEKERKNYWESFLGLADFIITPGPYCSRGPLTYLPKEKVEFVYDGSDYKLLNLDISGGRQSLRDSLKLPRDSFLIGMVGAFEARKGHDHLIRAIAKLSKLGYPIEAVICGGSGDSTSWRNLAKEEGVEDKIHFFGRLSELELAKVYKSLDVFSDLENSPRACGLTMSILEGMAMSLPVVIYNNKEMLEIVHEGENGFIVPINDIDALSNAILKMYQLSPEKRREMGARSSVYARKIDIDFTAHGKMELFKKIINNFNKKI